MEWDKKTNENWDAKMAHADKGLVLVNDEESESYNEKHSIPTKEEIYNILDGFI